MICFDAPDGKRCQYENVEDAATQLVHFYDDKAVDQEITALRSEWQPFWETVERLVGAEPWSHYAIAAVFTVRSTSAGNAFAAVTNRLTDAQWVSNAHAITKAQADDPDWDIFLKYGDAHLVPVSALDEDAESHCEECGLSVEDGHLPNCPNVERGDQS